MKKIKIVTIIGTRPEIIKLSEVIKEIDRHADHILVHTGQNYDYELNEIFFKDLGLRKPDHFLNVVGATLAETIANVIVRVDEVLEKEKPDALLVLGDTNSAIGAYAAKRRKIPIFHMEAGNRCFDMRVPEEVNRRIIDHISDINMPYSELARQNLLKEGLPLDRIIKTGSPMYEVLAAHQKEIGASNILSDLSLARHDYFVLSLHREENVDNPRHLQRLVSIIESVAAAYKKQIIFSVHPRTKKRLESGNITLPKQVVAMKPLGFFDYAHLQQNAFCVLSDSGTISEESAMLNFPGISLRETHERHEAIEEGTFILAGLDPERVLQAIEVAVAQKRGKERDFQLPEGYGVPNVSKKVLRTIVSYVDYVRRVVWSERGI